MSELVATSVGDAGPLREAGQRLVRARDQARRALRDAEARSAAFSPEMSVHQAWARHPGVARVFARWNLPDCPSCPVGADETLAEAAFAYEMPLDELLTELQSLLRC